MLIPFYSMRLMAGLIEDGRVYFCSTIILYIKSCPVLLSNRPSFSPVPNHAKLLRGRLIIGRYDLGVAQLMYRIIVGQKYQRKSSISPVVRNIE